MANRTDPLAKSIHGTNPQNLVEKIVRTKIYQSTYWKEQCFGLTAETLVDKAMELDHTGGTYGGNRKPTPFLCLALKMLQIQPDKDIVVEFIKNEDYKYARFLISANIVGNWFLYCVFNPFE
jgi:pre-mRNA-splicing factor 38A